MENSVIIQCLVLLITRSYNITLRELLFLLKIDRNSNYKYSMLHTLLFRNKIYCPNITIILRAWWLNIKSLDWKFISFAILVKPDRNVKVAFKVGLWSEQKRNQTILSIAIIIREVIKNKGKLCKVKALNF